MGSFSFYIFYMLGLLIYKNSEEKQKIFQTDAFHDLFEETARENMRDELEQLTQK